MARSTLIPVKPAVDVATSIVIARPVEVVAAYATDLRNAPDWYINIASVEWRTEPPLRVGSRAEFRASFLGRRLEYTYEIVELVPLERLVMRTSEGPFPMETSYSWERVGVAATEMTLRNRGIPSGFSKVVAPFLSIAIRRANRADLARLREILENGIDSVRSRR